MRQVHCAAVFWFALLGIGGSIRADFYAIDYRIESSPLLRIDAATGAVMPVGLTGFRRLNSLTMDPSGTLYVVGGALSGGADDKLISIDPASGAGTLLTTISLPGEPVSVRGMAIAPDGSFYISNDPEGSLGGAGPDNLWRIDPNTGMGTKIGLLGGYNFQSLDFGLDGQLYGWDFVSKSGGPQFRGVGLVRIDPATAAVTDVAPDIDSVDNTMQGIAFSADGNLYGIDGRLHVLDPATGAVRMIRPLTGVEQEIRGIEMVVPEPCLACAVLIGATVVVRRRRRVLR